MMFDTIQEITEAITEQENNMVNLRTRMEEHFDLWALAKYEAKDPAGNTRKGYEAYTSSAPRNYFDKVLDGLNRSALTIQILLPEGANEAERRAASAGELFLFGALNEVDRRQARRGEPPLRESLGFFMCLRGWWAQRALVYIPKGGKEVVFDVQAWDPLQVTGEMGSNGPLWLARKRLMTKGQILAEYNLTIKGRDGEVIDFWDEERNSVIVEGGWGKKPIAHKIGHVPVQTGAVGSMPTIQRGALWGATATSLGNSVLEERGDSVYSASADLYEARNKFVSWVMDNAEKSVAGSLIHQSKMGDKKLKGDPYASFQEIVTEEGESITPLELPKMPSEMAAVLAIIEQDISQSTLPYPLAYGGTQQAMSGRALSVLADATRSIYSPRTGKMALAYKWLCEELLAQFALKGTRATEIKGFKPDGEFFQMKIKPTEINPNWVVRVNVEPRMPRDEEAEVMIALAATQQRGPNDIPLMSKQTARESVLLIRDPETEEDKVLAEMGKGLPPIMAANIAAALKRRGQEELAEQVMMLLKVPGRRAPEGGTTGTQASPPLPPQLLEAIIQALVQGGQPQLAEALLRALGAGPPTEPGQGEMMPGAMPMGI